MNDDFGGAIAAIIVGLLLVAIVIFIYVFLFVLILGGFRLFHVLGLREQGNTQRLSPPLQLFNAPADWQWLSTYEHFLYKLEDITRMDFTTSPTRLIIGALILTLGVALLVGLLLAVLDPATGTAWLVRVTIIGAGIGGFTGWKLTQPLAGFLTSATFDERVSASSQHFLLGDEEW